MVCSSKASVCLGWAGLEAEEKKPFLWGSLLTSVTFWTQTPMKFPLQKQAGICKARHHFSNLNVCDSLCSRESQSRAGERRKECVQEQAAASAVQGRAAPACSRLQLSTDPGLLGLCTPSL